MRQHDADGNTLQPTDAPGVQDQPWLLPDAGSFVYHAQEDGKNLIYLQPTGPGARRVCLSPEDEGTAYVTPFPSPDGQWVAPAPPSRARAERRESTGCWSVSSFMEPPVGRERAGNAG